MPSPKTQEANRSRYAVLGALTLRPMSGYDLRRFFSTNIGFFWSESYGQLYPMLRALSAEGLVESTGEPGDRRREYRITDRGRRVLSDWLTIPATLEVRRIELLLKLFFAGNGPPGVAREQVRRFRAVQEEKLASYALVQARLNTTRTARHEMAYWLTTLAFGKRQAEAMLAFCDDAEALLPTAEGPALVPDAPMPRVVPSRSATKNTRAAKDTAKDASKRA